MTIKINELVIRAKIDQTANSTSPLATSQKGEDDFEQERLMRVTSWVKFCRER